MMLPDDPACDDPAESGDELDHGDIDDAFAAAIRHLDGMLRMTSRLPPPPHRDPAPTAPPG